MTSKDGIVVRMLEITNGIEACHVLLRAARMPTRSDLSLLVNLGAVRNDSRIGWQILKRTRV